MNACDEVFEILTRGPFPGGTRDDAKVEEHLEHCRDCRGLAQALQPALDLFHEAVAPEESRALPGYWGDVFLYRVEEPAGASRSIDTLTTPASRARMHRAAPIWRIAQWSAVVLAGVLIAAAVDRNGWFWGTSARQRDGRSDAVAATGAALVAPLDPRAAQVLALMPAACKTYDSREERATADSAVELDKLACCSGCHRAELDRQNKQPVRAPAPPVAAVLACVACHQQ